jgi:tetratricopeptide (TPR) repeat protein
LQPPFELRQEAYQGLGQNAKAAEAQQAALSSKVKVVPPLEDPLNEQLNSLSYSSTRLLKQAGLLVHQGYPDRAIEAARRAARAEPKDAEARSFIARTLLASYSDTPQAIDEALTELGESLRLRPEDPVALWMFTQDFFASPKSPAAVERLRTLMLPYANRPDAHLYLGMLANARGDLNEAVSQYQEALKKDPNSSGVYDNLGLALDKAGKFDQAIVYFRKAVQLGPMNSTAHYNLGRLLLQQGKDDEGMREIDEALRLKPDHAGSLFAMGFALLNARRPAEAMARLRQGLRYRPADAEAHYGLGAALAMEHKRDEAIAEFHEALRLRPQYPEARELLQQLER